jgi:hypothetical protein
VAALWDLKAVHLGEFGVVHVLAKLATEPGRLLVVHVRDAFEKEQGKDIGLEIRGVHRPTQDVGRLPEVRFEGG